MAPTSITAVRVALGVLLQARQPADANRTCTHEPRITGLIDGDMPGTDGLPKVVQIYFPCPDVGADEYFVALHRNKQSSKPDAATVALEHLVLRNLSKEGFIYVSPESEVFEEYMGFSPDYTNPKFFPRGVDSIELLRGNQTVDVYGHPHNDTEHEMWDFSAGTASRIYGTHPDADGGVITDWVIKKGQARSRASVTETGSKFVEFQTCAAYPCSGGRHREGQTRAKCKRRFCTQEDCSVCCTATACISAEQRQTKALLEKRPMRASSDSDCSNFTCLPGYVVREHPENIKCLGGICNDLDLNTCCSKAMILVPGRFKQEREEAMPLGGLVREGSMPGSVAAAKEAGEISFSATLWRRATSTFPLGPVSASFSQFLVAFCLLGGAAALSVALWRKGVAVVDEDGSFSVDPDHDPPQSRRSLIRCQAVSSCSA